MTTTARLLALLPVHIAPYKAALDATPHLNSVTITVQLDRYGPEAHNVLVEIHAGHVDKRARQTVQ